jgi:hypothetical protein
MIKNMLKRRKESDTYLATIRRHHWSRLVTMKIDKILELSASTVCSVSFFLTVFYHLLHVVAFANFTVK